MIQYIMEEWVLKIIIYVVFMKAILDFFGESPSNDRKKQHSLYGEDDDKSWRTCGIVGRYDDRQKVID